MKFQCSSCGLRLDSLHFRKDGLINPKLTSICDICIQRGLTPQDYTNKVVRTFAITLLYTYDGADDASDPETFIVNARNRKRYEATIQDYDGNEVAKHQVDREKFNQQIIASEDGKIDFVPSLDLDFAHNLQGLQIPVDFDLYKVDYIDRERIRAKYHYRCQYCGRYGKSVDHKNPVSISHDNSFDNLTLACEECNRIKSDMPYKVFVELNDRIQDINHDLVRYENTLGTLREEFQEKRRKLAAQVHLRGVIDDPELQVMRKQNKKLQDAIDSLNSDYDNLRKTRAKYFDTGWKLYQVGQREDIV